MLDRIANLAEENKAAITAIPIVAEIFASIKAKRDLIHSNHTVQLGDVTGITREKESVRLQLETNLRQDIKKAQGFFEFSKRISQAKRAGELLSTLQRVQDNQLADLTETFILLVTPFEAELAQLNMKADRLTSLRELGKTFGTLIHARATAGNASVDATSQIDALLKEAKAILRLQLDNVMEVFADQSPELLKQYHAMRKVVYRHRRRNKEETEEGTATATVKLVDATTFEPVVGGTLAVDGKVLEDVTDEAGELDVLNLRPGTHEFAGTAEGYATAVLTAATPEAGEDYTFELNLSKA